MIAFIENENDYYERMEEFYANNNKQYVYRGELEPILHIACRIGSLENVINLISKGADTKATTYWGNCLHIATMSEHSNIAKYLIEIGVDYNEEDVQGFTPLIHACSEGMEDIVDILLKKDVNVNVDGGHARTALNRAIECGYTSIAKKLIDAGAFIDGDDTTYGRIPLTEAVLKNNDEIFKVLIEKGANINKRDHKGNGSTALELINKYKREFL
jgi:ankyrin repeat protein